MAPWDLYLLLSGPPVLGLPPPLLLGASGSPAALCIVSCNVRSLIPIIFQHQPRFRYTLRLLVIMGLCSFFSVALFGASVQAIAFPGPSPTNDIYAIQEDGWTPMPTAPPGVHEVLRRQNRLASTYIMAPDNTCGFVSGRSSACQPYYRKNKIKITLVTNGSLKRRHIPALDPSCDVPSSRPPAMYLVLPGAVTAQIVGSAYPASTVPT